jgi:succinyl-diaminopimelate desuccinylase
MTMQTLGLNELLADLVSIHSVNAMGRREGPPSSERMVTYLERWLGHHGIACHRQEAAGEQNLIATVPGPKGAPTIVFDAHTDTVPAPGWADRAFIPRVENGRLYGRGACDTKGCMAAMLWALAEAAKSPGQLANNIVFLASADEEYGRTGVKAYLDSRPDVQYAIVGEPTSLQPVIACKGAARWDIVVPGASAHSSTPRKGTNAITRAAQVQDATMTPTMIQGGSAPNVVPDVCRVHVDLRTMPNEDPLEAARSAQSYLEEELDFAVAHENLRLWHGADLAPEHPLVQRAGACAARVGQGPVQPIGVNYGCHASDYMERGIPAVVIGPGDIAVAHAVDEYLELEQLPRAAVLYLSLMTEPIA